MLKLTFITIGDLPKGPFSEIRDKLLKPMKQFVSLMHRIAKDEPSALKQVPDGDVLIVLDAAGKMFTSEQLAMGVKQFEDQGQHITVLLGGPKGLSLETKQKARLLLSLSRMTTTHDLAHLLFLEQLYRVMTITHGKTYHY